MISDACVDYCQKDGLAGLHAGFWLLVVLCNLETCVCPEFGHALVTCSHGFTCQANLIEFDEESDTCACPLLGAFGRCGRFYYTMKRSIAELEEGM